MMNYGSPFTRQNFGRAQGVTSTPSAVNGSGASAAAPQQVTSPMGSTNVQMPNMQSTGLQQKTGQDPASGTTGGLLNSLAMYDKISKMGSNTGPGTAANANGTQSELGKMLGGMGAGASAGSAFGPWGAGIGAIGGGILGSFF